MNRLSRLLLICLAACSLWSCSTRMPLNESSSISGFADRGIAVFRVTTQNDFTDYALVPRSVTVEGTTAVGSSKSETFDFGDPAEEPSAGKCELVGSLGLPAGQYELKELFGFTNLGIAGILPVRGRFDPDINKTFEIQNNEIVYIGHIVARLVEKTSDTQERAGPVLPIADQLATGMSDGTFVFEIRDDFEADIASLRSKYSIAPDIKIRKSLLR